MKLTVAREHLQDGLRKVLNVVSSRSTIPVRGNVLLRARGDELTLSTTDLEVSITTRLPATIEREGETTLPARKFGQIANVLAGPEVTLDTDENLATQISCGHATFRLLGLEASEFPTESEFQEDRRFELPAADFGRCLRRIHYAVSADPTRYVLNGIYLSVTEGALTCVATDGRRLALVEKALEDGENVTDGSVILPIKVVNELLRLCDTDADCLVKISDARAAFQVGETILYTKLVEGSFPSYRQVIPQSFKNAVTLPRESFADVLNRVAQVVTDSGASVKLSLQDNECVLSASSSDVGEASEPLEVSYQEEPLHIAFSPNFLREPLKNLDCDELTMRFNDEFKPVVFIGDEGFLYVIMPMRK